MFPLSSFLFCLSDWILFSSTSLFVSLLLERLDILEYGLESLVSLTAHKG